MAAVFFAAVFFAAAFFAGAAVFFAEALTATGVAVFLAGAAVFLAGVVFAGAFLATAFFAGAAVFFAAFFVAKGVPLVMSFLLPVFLVPAAFLGAAMPPRGGLAFFAADAEREEAALFFETPLFLVTFAVFATGFAAVVFLAAGLPAVFLSGLDFLSDTDFFSGADFLSGAALAGADFFAGAVFVAGTVVLAGAFFAGTDFFAAFLPGALAALARFVALLRLDAMLFSVSPTLTEAEFSTGSSDILLGGV